MGRVSRHRKIKACDPFYKGKRKELPQKSKKGKKSREVTGVEEQKMPRAMKDLLRRKQQIMGKNKNKLKRLDVTNKTESKTNKEPMFQQKKGETKKEYFYRIDQEAASSVVESMKKDQKMSERRKSHLKKRKEKEKVKRNPERALPHKKDFSDLKDEVRFGDVASQPPIFTAKPRKAPLQSKGTKSLLLSSKFVKENKAIESTDKPEVQKEKKSIPKSTKRKHMTAIEKAILDKERIRVIEAYRTAKKQKLATNTL